MADLPPILTSGSAYSAWLKCPRLRWWQHEAPSGDGQRGWERRKLDLPLSTGGWCHKIAQGLFEIARARAAGTFIEATSTAVIIETTKLGYLREIYERGMELGLSLDGAVPEEVFIQRTIQEQAALIEAFGWAFNRVRLPRLLEEYELLDVEREEYTLLSGDVGLQSRCDAVLRRKADQRLFVYNLKTSGSSDKKWQDSFQFNQQIITEVLAVERRLGERVYGVIVDGFDKGPRVTCWWHGLKEVREGYSKAPAEGDEKWQRQRSRLLYGYKCEETIPGRPTLYDFEGTTRKGWGPFAIFTENFSDVAISNYGSTPVEQWLHWLPIEQVEACFVTLPAIMRQDQQVESKVRQMVQVERQISERRQRVDHYAQDGHDHLMAALDNEFPQHDGYNCLRCPMQRLCWEEGCASDPIAAGYQPRQSNHPEPELE